MEQRVKDATGKVIVLGKRYGYAKTSNGSYDIVIGTANGITFGTEHNGPKVQLKDIKQQKGLWGEMQEEISDRKRKTTVYSCILFKVEDEPKPEPRPYSHVKSVNPVPVQWEDEDYEGFWSASWVTPVIDGEEFESIQVDMAVKGIEVPCDIRIRGGYLYVKSKNAEWVMK